jgi:hypothetical protein
VVEELARRFAADGRVVVRHRIVGRRNQDR